jgi:hypothetical protein
MTQTFDKIVMNSLGSEFGLKSEIFQQFVYFILKDKLNSFIELQVHNDGLILTIINIPNKEIGLIINDLATIIKPLHIIYKPRVKYIDDKNDSHKMSDSHYKLYKGYSPFEGVKKISRSAIDCNEQNNVGLPPLQNTCQYRGNYVASESKCLAKDNSNLFLNKAIDYDMQYIVNDIKNDIHLDALEMIIRKHNLKLFDMCAPLLTDEIQKSNSILLLAINEKQYEMFYKLLKYGALLTTKCVEIICTLDESKKLMTWVNLYGDDSNVDYYQCIANVTDSELLKMFLHSVEPDYIMNKAIYENNFEIFTNFYNLVDYKSLLSPCIEQDRLNMIEHIFKNEEFDDATFNQILKNAVKFGKIDVIKYIAKFENNIWDESWNESEFKIEYIMDKEIIPFLFDKYPHKYKLLLNAVYKNDDWIVQYIIDNIKEYDLFIRDFHDMIFKQVLINNNANIMKMLLRVPRTSSFGLNELLELTNDSEMIAILKDAVVGYNGV